MNISVKFLMASEEMIFENLFAIKPFCGHGNQLNSAVWTKIIWLVEDYSRNISVKLMSKYLQWHSNKCQNFHLSHYKSMATISCHGNQSSHPIGTKNIFIHSPGLKMLHVKFGGNRLHGFWADVVWKCWRTDDGCLPILYYKLTCEPSAQVS